MPRSMKSKSRIRFSAATVTTTRLMTIPSGDPLVQKPSPTPNRLAMSMTP